MPEIFSVGLQELYCVKLVKDLLYEHGVLSWLSSVERLCVCVCVHMHGVHVCACANVCARNED